MFEILFYEDKNGNSELFNELEQIAKLAPNNKNYRIQLKQITFCIELLKAQGLQLPTNIAKYLTEDVWELRPGNNRILYFYFKENKFVLLHMFKKKTKKTPQKEIDKAIREINDYKNRFGGKQL